jgi:hypothetical protein
MPKGVHTNQPKGKNHYRWNNSQIVSEHGYIKIRVGKSHPLADPNGYAYEHLLVWCAAGNLRPTQNELIHHCNGDKLDNRIENLELITRSDHNRYHNAYKERDSLGRFVSKQVK